MKKVINMKKETKGLYTLKHISAIENVETPITFTMSDGTEKMKLTLTDIDSFTLQFDCKENMLFYMQKLGYKFYNSKFIIEYQNNHETKMIKPVFSDQETLKYFAQNNQGSYIVKKDNIYYKYLGDIVYMVSQDAELAYFLRKNNYISSWLYRNIIEYFIFKNDDVEASHINMDRIKKELSQYRVIRSLEIGIKEYNKEKDFKQQIEDRKKTFVKTKQKKQIEGQEQLFNPDNY